MKRGDSRARPGVPAQGGRAEAGRGARLPKDSGRTGWSAEPAAWPSPFLAGAFFLSGAAALIYELLWFRLLGHVFGSTATATSTLLAAYLFGLGLGAWAFGKLSDRITRIPIVYVAVEAAIGLYGIASHALLKNGASLYALAHSWAAGSPGRLLFARFAVSFVLVVIPTTLMGGTFPLMVHLLKTQRVQIGRAAGRAYAINTAGAAVGAIALPGLLLPWLGIAASLAVAAVLNFGAAACAGLFARRLSGIEAALAASRRGSTTLVGLAGEAAGAQSAQAPVQSPPALPTPVGPAPAGAAPAGLAPGPTIVLPPAAASVEGEGDGAAASRSRERGPAARFGSPAIDPMEAAAAGAAFSPAAALLIGFFLSSFAALALETVWTRQLSIFFGAQTFTFAFVLFGYLLGLFIGGAAYARFRAFGADPALLLRRALIVTAAGVAAPLPFMAYLAVPQIDLMLAIGVSNGSFLATIGVVTIALVLVPAFGFGLIFPAVVDLLAREGRKVGSSVGLTYVVNTVGTTLGALGAGFLLVPVFGSQRTIEICVILTAAALFLAGEIPVRGAARTPSNGLRYGLPAAFLIVLLMPRWNWAFAHAQYSKDPLNFLEKYSNGSIWNTIAKYNIPFLEEGIEATVSVCDFGFTDVHSLYVNGKPDASDIPDDMVAQRLLACIPGLFHPNPKRALVIGVGSGTTVATLKRFPVEAIDAAEISPEVIEAAKRFFGKVNERFLEDGRVWLRLDDGRNFLHFQPPSTYDIIISEPSNPWMAGVSALFTDEFFAEAKSKLRPGGILCQWFHYYNMSIDHIRLLARTFRRHFPEAALFVVRGDRPTGDIILIGSNGPLRLARLPEDPSLPEGVRAALAEVGNPGTQQIMSGLVASPGDFEAFGRTGPVNTDDLPILEFEAPGDRFLNAFYETLSALLTSTESTFLTAGPTMQEVSSLQEMERNGFAPASGPPAGEETKRGVTVLSRFRPGGDDLSRWALIGQDFRDEARATGLYRLARQLARPDELVDIGSTLAGPGMVSRNEITVNGHIGLSILAEADGKRTVVVSWNCPVQNRAFLVSRRVPSSGAPDPAALASELAKRFPCAHAAH